MWKSTTCTRGAAVAYRPYSRSATGKPAFIRELYSFLHLEFQLILLDYEPLFRQMKRMVKGGPVKYIAPEDREVWFCNCKQTKHRYFSNANLFFSE